MKQCILLLVLFVAHGVRCQSSGVDNNCNDADFEDLAQSGIFPTTVVAQQIKGISEDVVKKQLEAAKTEITDTITKEEEQFRIEVEAGKKNIEYEKPVLGVDKVTTDAIATELSYYKHVCPYRYYYLWRFKWAFYLYNKKKFCWPFWPIAVTSCVSRYCRWWYKPNTWWYYSGRCFPRYVYKGILARCVSFENNQLVWSTEYVYIPIPRGCNCRWYYNPYITAAQQCQAIPGLTRG